MMKQKRQVVVVRKSRLTGKAVWVYRGASLGSARWTYFKACCAERRRIQTWCERALQRRSNILRLLSKCLEHIPLDAVFTPEQNAAARTLRKISAEKCPPDMEFYNHIEHRNSEISKQRQ